MGRIIDGYLREGRGYPSFNQFASLRNILSWVSIYDLTFNLPMILDKRGRLISLSLAGFGLPF